MRTLGRTILVVAVVVWGAACAPSAKKIAEQQEKNPQYQYEKAVVCMQYNMPDEAIKYLNATIALDPRSYLAYNLLGLALMVKTDLPGAVRAFESSIAVNPDFSEAHNNLGTAYQESGQTEKAEAEFKAALALDQNYNASYNLAKLDYGQNKFDAALNYVLQSLQKFNRSLLAWNLLGLIYDSLEKFEDAIRSFEQALKIVPGEVNVSYNLGVAYYKNKQFDKAKEVLEKVLPSVKSDDLKAKFQEVLKKISTR